MTLREPRTSWTNARRRRRTRAAPCARCRVLFCVYPSPGKHAAQIQKRTHTHIENVIVGHCCTHDAVNMRGRARASHAVHCLGFWLCSARSLARLSVCVCVCSVYHTHTHTSDTITQAMRADVRTDSRIPMALLSYLVAVGRANAYLGGECDLKQ